MAKLKTLSEDELKLLPSNIGNRARLIGREELCARIGVTYSTIWQWIADNKFPPGRSISSDSVRGRTLWLESEIDAWIAALPIRRPKGNKVA
jgi:predicted DNA-binding transcriptional regulator AlpA